MGSSIASLKFASLALFASLASINAFAQVTLTGTSYTQNFNSIGSGLPTGWTVYTGATSSTLGTSSSITTAATSWGTTSGDFRNAAASTGLSSTSDVTAQSNSTDRALGVRQGASFGDPGASFVFNFNSTGMTDVSFSLDVMMLSVQGRSTDWTLQYSTNGTAWTNITTWSDPGVFGSTTLNSAGVVASLTNQSNAYIRLVALSASTGSNSRDTIAIDNFSLTYSAVPEPATSAFLAGAAILGLATFRRRSLRVKPANLPAPDA
jgi:uncharacterized protein